MSAEQRVAGGTFLDVPGPVLAEGSVYERLRRQPDIPFDEHVGTGGLALEERYRDVLADVHRGYLRIGLDAGLPMLLQTDTWRASGERIAASPWRGVDVNRENVALLAEVVDEGRAAGGTILLAGMLGPAGDAYDPSVALSAADALRHHTGQAQALAEAGVELLLCATLPALSEALGLAAAMAETGLPYVVGFVVRPTGRLLDGTALDEAVATIDEAVDPAPAAYLVNCVHPTVADAALSASPRAAARVTALLANTSARDPDELDGLEQLETADSEPFASAIDATARRHGLTLLGGCCGTDERHIAALARLIAAPSRA